jgi:hypothetical protein
MRWILFRKKWDMRKTGEIVKFGESYQRCTESVPRMSFAVGLLRSLRRITRNGRAAAPVLEGQE